MSRRLNVTGAGGSLDSRKIAVSSTRGKLRISRQRDHRSSEESMTLHQLKILNVSQGT